MDDKLEKRSKNVREQTRNITVRQAHERIMQYIRRAGFHAEQSRQDRFGVGKDQRGLLYNPTVGSPRHELAHALMTPVGESLREHQQKLGQVTSSVNMPREDRQAEEMATFAMEPQLARRAGIGIANSGAHQFHANPKESNPATASNYAIGRTRGVGELNAFDEGRKTISSTGHMVQGTGIHAKINERAMKKSDENDKDVLAPSEKPTPTSHEDAGLQAPQWKGRSIAHKDHAQELEHDSAINEFEHKMMRGEAEEKAHSDYVQRQHTEAAAHHLAGMKAAHASGDIEAARKHGVMYELHSKALGHKPVGPAHPDVLKHMEKKPGGVYRFKSHRGDLFAIDQKPKEEGMDKHEALRALYQALEPLVKATRFARQGGDELDEYNMRDRAAGGRGDFDETEYGEHLDSDLPHAGRERSQGPFDEIGGERAQMARQSALRSIHEEKARTAAHANVPQVSGCPGCGNPMTYRLATRYPSRYPTHHEFQCGTSGCGMTLHAPLRAPGEMGKAELKPGKPTPCVCKAYDFPHRHKSGKCGK